MKRFLPEAVSLFVILSCTLLFFAVGYLAAGGIGMLTGREVDVISWASFAGLAGFFGGVIFLLRK